MRLAFTAGHLSFRGTDVALDNDAHFAESRDHLERSLADERVDALYTIVHGFSRAIRPEGPAVRVVREFKVALRAASSRSGLHRSNAAGAQRRLRRPSGQPDPPDPVPTATLHSWPR